MTDDAELAGAILTIDLDALADNYRLLRRTAAPALCAGVVKADAYGLGADRVGPALAAAGCRHFFVAHVAEGIRLRRSVPAETEVFVLHGPPPGAEAALVEHRLIPVLNSLQQVDAWARLARRLGRKLDAILQVDTGMSRLGLPADEVERIVADPGRLASIELRYVMSHLACADDPADPTSDRQLETFARLRAKLPSAPATLANSPGVFRGPDFHFDLVRPGVSLYGVAPIPSRPNPMRPVVCLQGRVIQERWLEPGDGVGYSLTWRAPERRRIATVMVGYADGFPWSLANRARPHLGEVDLPVVGRVSMDTITLDVTALPEGTLKPGSLVDLISARHTVDALAAEAGTIGYEILTRLGPRYHRTYAGGPG
jgi:alanine racemase